MRKGPPTKVPPAAREGPGPLPAPGFLPARAGSADDRRTSPVFTTLRKLSFSSSLSGCAGCFLFRRATRASRLARLARCLSFSAAPRALPQFFRRASARLVSVCLFLRSVFAFSSVFFFVFRLLERSLSSSKSCPGVRACAGCSNLWGRKMAVYRT